MNHHHQSTTTRTTTTATTTTTTTRTQPLTLSPRPSNLTQHSTIKSSKSHSRPPTSAALPLSHLIHQPPPPPPPSDYNPTHSFTSSPFTSHHPKRKSSSNQLTIHQIQPEPITQNNPTTIIKKRRRRRSAITGTLYNPDEEPDPDQEILSQSNHQASLHSSSSQKSKSTLVELQKKSQSKPSQSSSSSNVLEKKFACDWIGCQKVFSRPDHLSRHRLNHEPEKIYSCDRCPRKFVRAEAKVEGLGGRRTSDPPMIITDPKSVQNPDYEISSSTPYSSIPFPSTTNTTPLISRGKEMVEEKASYGTDEFNLTQGLPGLFLSTDNFAVDVPFFTGQDFQWLFDGFLDDLDQHQHLFHPTPNLLLEPTHHLEPTRSTTDNHQLQNEEENKNGFVKEMNRCHDLSGYQSIQPPPPPPPLQDDGSRWNGNGLELVNHQHHQHPPHPSLNEEKKLKGPLLRIHSIEEILRSIPFLPPPPLSPSSTTPLPSFTKNRMMNRTSTEPDSFSNRFELDPTDSKSQASHPSHHYHQLASVRPIRDLSVYVSFETRDRILQTVKNELSFLENDHRFGCEEISKYLNLYWIHVHQTSFPILHRPTFKTSEASVFLLCLMICLGAYFTDSEGHGLATILYEDIRKRVISSPEFKPRASLDIIQVTLLMILYGKLCSTRNHHEMAHIFWGSILTMYRRSALFSPRVSSIPNELKNSIDVQWKVWIEDESSKRAAYAAFLIDVQHAAIFRHAPTLSAFHIQHVLPSDEEEWNAKDSISWNEIHLRILSHQRRMGGGGGGGEEEEDEENYQGGGNRGTLFMSALKASLMPGMAPPFLNPFSRVVILHGLISVAFDLQWRDVFMIGLVTSNETPSIHPNGIKKDWREMIAAAFNSWKICLDSCLISSNAPAHQLLTASISIYALAHIVLSIDVHELQIYTGAEITIGLTVANQVAQKNTRSKVKRWAHTKEGRASTWHAAHFLRSSLIDLDQVNETIDSLHYTWACYISVLTVVAYGTALNEIEMDLINEEEEGWNGWVQKKKKNRSLTRLKLNEIKSNPFQIATNYLDKMCTSCPEDLKDLKGVDHQVESIGLIEMIYRVIKSSRWEIALEGAKILEGLIISKSKDLI
ncbi:fungal-specific transcription factor domain-containing protein [Melampsora americana]|nr:fungal-specific transcription factor domain-containing protein [Melampsora americana]